MEKGCRQRADCCSVLLLTFAEKKEKDQGSHNEFAIFGSKAQREFSHLQNWWPKKNKLFFSNRAQMPT
jgi:hypothetical protein